MQRSVNQPYIVAHFGACGSPCVANASCVIDCKTDVWDKKVVDWSKSLHADDQSGGGVPFRPNSNAIKFKNVS